MWKWIFFFDSPKNFAQRQFKQHQVGLLYATSLFRALAEWDAAHCRMCAMENGNNITELFTSFLVHVAACSLTPLHGTQMDQRDRKRVFGVWSEKKHRRYSISFVHMPVSCDYWRLHIYTDLCLTQNCVCLRHDLGSSDFQSDAMYYPWQKEISFKKTMKNLKQK